MKKGNPKSFGVLSTNVPLKCSYCIKEFNYKSDLKRHESSHNPQFACEVCSKRFSFLSALRRHEKQHLRNGSVGCEKCGRKFRDETLLMRHMKYAHKSSIICPKCLTVFNSEAALRNHSLTHQPKSERKYHCSFEGCKKSFNFPHHLRNHELTHTNEKKYFCNVCGKGFIQSQNLKNHLKTHEPDSLLCCTVKGCKKKYATEYSRKKHIATHNISKADKNVIGLSNGMLCPSCGDLVSKRNIESHLESCVSKQNRKTDEVELTNNNKTEDREICEPIDGPAKGNYCKTALGSCMSTGGPEMEDNCLCAQMSTDMKVFENNIDFDTLNPERDNKSVDEAMLCCSCDCGKEIINKTDTQVSNPKRCEGSMPSLEFRANGVIKLKETIDVNIPFVESSGCNSKGLANNPNSCKAVLGNCIVSGDDTIGEGCLCARMSAQAQPYEDFDDISAGAFDS